MSLRVTINFFNQMITMEALNLLKITTFLMVFGNQAIQAKINHRIISANLKRGIEAIQETILILLRRTLKEIKIRKL